MSLTLPPTSRRFVATVDVTVSVTFNLFGIFGRGLGIGIGRVRLLAKSLVILAPYSLSLFAGLSVFLSKLRAIELGSKLTS